MVEVWLKPKVMIRCWESSDLVILFQSSQYLCTDFIYFFACKNDFVDFCATGFKIWDFSKCKNKKFHHVKSIFCTMLFTSLKVFKNSINSKYSYFFLPKAFYWYLVLFIMYHHCFYIVNL